MPDSVGGGGFPRNINIGHEHLDLSSDLRINIKVMYQRMC